MPFHWLLSLMVSDEKPTVNPFDDPSYITRCFSVFALGLLFSFDSLIIMCPGVTLLELILFELVELLGCVD